MSFADYYVKQRSAKSSLFYNQINTLIDWNKLEKVINRYYHKGETLQGQKPYNGVLLFKMLLLGIWNDLSDVRTESYVNDSLSAMRFCGLNLESPRINQKLKTKYNNDPNIGGRVINDNIGNRKQALEWEYNKVFDFSVGNSRVPKNQIKPQIKE